MNEQKNDVKTSLEQALQEAGMRLVPANFGPIKGADANTRFTGPCGDTMEFWIQVHDGNIVNCSYMSDGCSISVYCGASIGQSVLGKPVKDVMNLTEDDYSHILDELSIDETDCIKLSLITLKKTVSLYLKAHCSSNCGDCGADCAQRKTESTTEASENTPCDETSSEAAGKEAESSEMSKSSEQRKNIVVISGKGGVGKSTVSVNLAYTLKEQGYRVGLMDIDFHGPSIPVMLGVEANGLETIDQKLVPLEVNGVKVVSMGFLLPSGDSPVIWRGPMKMGVIKQFIEEVNWGDLDYLVVDCPPGTGDEPLSVCQALGSNTSALVVTTPQEVAASDVRRSVRFCERLELPVIGVVENMSGFICKSCGAVTPIFGQGGGEATAKSYGLHFLGNIPVDPSIGENGDRGVAWDSSLSPAAQSVVMEELTKAVLSA